MTATTTDVQRQRRGLAAIDPYPVKASEAIPKGALVSIDVNGYAVNTTNTASEICVGVAGAAVTGGAASGDKTIPVESDAVFRFTATTIAQADVPDIFGAVDNNTVDAVGVLNVKVGRCVGFISSTEAWVFVPRAGLAASL